MKTTTHIRAPSPAPQSRGWLTLRTVLKSGLLAFALAIGLRVSGQTTTTTTNFSVNMGVPDAVSSGLASTKTVATPITYISGLKVSVKLSGTWNGDIYCYLTHSSGYTVLLNRVGRRTGSSLGYGDGGFDVTFDDGAANGDIHHYRLTLNNNETTPISGALTNVWAPDGRTNNPTGVLDGNPRSALLSSFNGTDPNGEWVLFVADMESGDLFTLDNWGLEITGYTPPSIVANPVSATNECSTGSTLFSVTAIGSSNLVYQWRHNGSSVSGATDSALTLNSPTFNDAGNYDVVITNTYGAATSLVATLTVIDTTPPSITCPPVVVVNTDPDVCFASGVNLGTPVASDTCGNVALSNNAPSQFQLGTNTVVWTATDEHGNVSNCTQTVVVRDIQPPVITAPVALTDVSTDPGKCYATSVALGTPQSHDNCGILTVTNDAPAQFQKGDTTVTWTAVDNSGNIATATQVVTVKDHELPTITAPAALADVHTDNGQCYATSVSLGAPVTADNCPGPLTVTNNAPAQFPKGDTTVIWTVVDTSGNMATASQLVTVQDHELPTITAPATVTINADAGKCFAATVNLGTPVTADNCPGPLTVTNNAPSQYQVGTNTVTWTVIDTSGNLASATQSVIVNDSQVPSVTCPANITVYTTNLGGIAVTFSPTAQDNCGVQSVVASPASGDTFPIGDTTVTVTATDIHGNTNQCSFTVSVILDHAPVAGNIYLGAVANHPRALLIDKILGESSDPDNDTMTVVAVSATSTNGGTVMLTETNIIYTPAANYAGDDLFTYTISDGHSGSATGAILVRVLSAAEASLNLVSGPTATNGTVVVRFAGIPGYTHTVERSQDQSTWTAIGTFTVPDSGIVQFTDSAPPAAPYYYRTAVQ